MSDFNIIDRHRLMDLIAEELMNFANDDSDFIMSLISDGYPGVDNMGDNELLDELEDLGLVDAAMAEGVIELLG